MLTTERPITYTPVSEIPLMQPTSLDALAALGFGIQFRGIETPLDAELADLERVQQELAKPAQVWKPILSKAPSFLGDLFRNKNVVVNIEDKDFDLFQLWEEQVDTYLQEIDKEAKVHDMGLFMKTFWKILTIKLRKETQLTDAQILSFKKKMENSTYQGSNEGLAVNMPGVILSTYSLDCIAPSDQIKSSLYITMGLLGDLTYNARVCPLEVKILDDPILTEHAPGLYSFTGTMTEDELTVEQCHFSNKLVQSLYTGINLPSTFDGLKQILETFDEELYNQLINATSYEQAKKLIEGNTVVQKWLAAAPEHFAKESSFLAKLLFNEPECVGLNPRLLSTHLKVQIVDSCKDDWAFCIEVQRKESKLFKQDINFYEGPKLSGFFWIKPSFKKIAFTDATSPENLAFALTCHQKIPEALFFKGVQGVNATDMLTLVKKAFHRNGSLIDGQNSRQFQSSIRGLVNSALAMANSSELPMDTSDETKASLHMADCIVANPALQAFLAKNLLKQALASRKNPENSALDALVNLLCLDKSGKLLTDLLQRSGFNTFFSLKHFSKLLKPEHLTQLTNAKASKPWLFRQHQAQPQQDSYSKVSAVAEPTPRPVSVVDLSEGYGSDNSETAGLMSDNLAEANAALARAEAIRNEVNKLLHPEATGELKPQVEIVDMEEYNLPTYQSAMPVH